MANHVRVAAFDPAFELAMVEFTMAMNTNRPDDWLHAGTAVLGLLMALVPTRAQRGTSPQVVGSARIEDQVVDDRPLLGQKEGVAALAGRDLVDVDRQDLLEDGAAAAALDADAAHVTEVEEADVSILRWVADFSDADTFVSGLLTTHGGVVGGEDEVGFLAG